MSRLGARIVDQRVPGDPFGAKALAHEVNRRWAGKLKRPAGVRTMGAFLRRLHYHPQAMPRETVCRR